MSSALTALKVLETMAESQPVGVSDMARRLELPKSSAQRALVTLAEAGWIRRFAGNEQQWVLTTRALSVGMHVSEEFGVPAAAEPAMEQLRLETAETIHLVVQEGASVVLVKRLDSPQAVRAFYPVGARLPIHAASTGKAILAWLSEQERHDLLAESLESYTASTVRSRAALESEMTVIKERGFAVNRGEFRSDVSAVGAAIRGPRGNPLAAMSISVPSMRLPEDAEERYGPRVVEAVGEVAKGLTHGLEPRS